MTKGATTLFVLVGFFLAEAYPEEEDAFATRRMAKFEDLTVRGRVPPPQMQAGRSWVPAASSASWPSWRWRSEFELRSRFFQLRRRKMRRCPSRLIVCCQGRCVCESTPNPWIRNIREEALPRHTRLRTPDYPPDWNRCLLSCWNDCLLAICMERIRHSNCKRTCKVQCSKECSRKHQQIFYRMWSHVSTARPFVPLLVR
ncbi:uncharacterized protein [Dermacentor albipictus]|uniref:uncharacterized protein n=1 Tax=Dermacentor albipictus TaxID=60249 RepID=UPI0031FCD3C8